MRVVRGNPHRRSPLCDARDRHAGRQPKARVLVEQGQEQRAGGRVQPWHCVKAGTEADDSARRRQCGQATAESRLALEYGIGKAGAHVGQIECVHSPALIDQHVAAILNDQHETFMTARNAALANNVRSAALVLANDGPIEIAGARLAAFVSGGDFRAP